MSIMDGPKDRLQALNAAVDDIIPPVIEENITALVERSYANSRAHGFHDHGDVVQEAYLDAQTALSRDPNDPGNVRDYQFARTAYIEHLGNRLMLIAGEVSEAHEDLRDGREPDEVYFEDKPDGSMKPCGYPIELADAVIRIFDEAGRRGIDLASAIAIKMRYNEGRPMLHGKIM